MKSSSWWWYNGWTAFRDVCLVAGKDTEKIRRREWLAVKRYWKDTQAERIKNVRY